MMIGFMSNGMRSIPGIRRWPGRMGLAGVLVASTGSVGCRQERARTLESGRVTPVPIVVQKSPPAAPARTPQVVPWVELNTSKDSDVDNVVEGLERWSRVTETAIVSTVPGKSFLLTTLRNRVGGMRIVPGLKTHALLQTFDSVEGWRRVASEVMLLCEAADSRIIVLENESAMKSYLAGDDEVDSEQLGRALAELPWEIELLWYPGIHGRADEKFERSSRIARVVAGRGNVRLVDLGFAGPQSVGQSWSARASTRMKELSGSPVVPLLYCYGDDRWWTDEQVPDAVLRFEDGWVILYPGARRWVQAAESIGEKLRRRGLTAGVK